MPDREPEFLQEMPLEESIKFFREKVNVPIKRYDDLTQEAYRKSFAIAGMTKAEMLNQFRSAVDDAIAKGEGLEEFRKKFDAAAANWDYRGGRDWRSWIIYDTNIRKAYAEGLERRMQDPALRRALPYAIYLHGNSKVPRPEHLSWDQKILPIDDPWWNTHNPPMGFGCSCIKKYLSREELPLIYKAKEFATKQAVQVILNQVSLASLQATVTKSAAGVKVSATAGVKTEIPLSGELLKGQRPIEKKGTTKYGNVYDGVIMPGKLLEQINKADVTSSPLLLEFLNKGTRLEDIPHNLRDNILDDMGITAHKELSGLIPQPPKETLHADPIPRQLDELYQYLDVKKKQHPIPTAAKNLADLAKGGVSIKDIEQVIVASGKVMPDSILSILFKDLKPGQAAQLLEDNLLQLEAKSNYYSHLKDYILTNEKLLNASGDIFITKTSNGIRRAYRMVKGKRIPMPIAVANDLVAKGIKAEQYLGIPEGAVKTVKPSQHLSIETIKLLKFLLSINSITK